MYLVQPWKKNRHNGQVLQRQDFETWKERIDQLGNQAVTPPYGYDGYLAGRLWLSDALRANVNNANVPLTHLLYIGHIKGSGDASALLLNDLAEVFGLDEVESGDFRWFSAMDLTKGTTTWREKTFERLNMEADQDGAPLPPRVKSSPAALLCPWTSSAKKQSPPWTDGTCGPCPHGLASSPATPDPNRHRTNPSASLQDASRPVPNWCSPPDGRCTPTRPSSTTSRRTTQSTRSTNWPPKVDEFLQSDTPIEDMSQWKRDKLAAWREHPSDIASAPITWAGLTVYRAPDVGGRRTRKPPERDRTEAVARNRPPPRGYSTSPTH